MQSCRLGSSVQSDRDRTGLSIQLRILSLNLAVEIQLGLRPADI